MKSGPVITLVGISLCACSCSHTVRPYSDKREQARTEVRDTQQTDLRQAYEDGFHQGQIDFANREPGIDNIPSLPYVTAKEKAIGDGYRDGYNAAR